MKMTSENQKTFRSDEVTTSQVTRKNDLIEMLGKCQPSTTLDQIIQSEKQKEYLTERGVIKQTHRNV